MIDPTRDVAVADVGKYYDREIEFAEASGAGIIWFLGRDHLSPALTNADEFALDASRWRDAISGRVLHLGRRMGIKHGDLVLDLGCGVGGPGRDLIRSLGCRVKGVTNSAKQVENLKRLSAIEGSSYDDVTLGDMQRLEMPDSSVDHALAINSVYHAPDAGAVIAEAARVIVPGGSLGLDDWFITTRANPAIHDQLRKYWSARRGFHEWASVLREVAGHGFEIMETIDYTQEAGEFLCEERFGHTFDRQVAPVLLQMFPRMYVYPEYRAWHPAQAVRELREAILFMGQLYRRGHATYQQIVARREPTSS